MSLRDVLNTGVFGTLLEFTDSGSLMQVASVSKLYRSFVSALFKGRTATCQWRRWPWDEETFDDEAASPTFQLFIRHFKADVAVVNALAEIGRQTTNLDRLFALLSTEESFHSVHFLQRLAVGVWDDDNGLVLSVVVWDRYYADILITLGLYGAARGPHVKNFLPKSLAMEALTFLRSRILAAQWGRLTQSPAISSDDVLIEGFFTIAESKGSSHTYPALIRAIADLPPDSPDSKACEAALEEINLFQTECNRRMVRGCIAAIASVVWQRLIDAVLTAIAADNASSTPSSSDAVTDVDNLTGKLAGATLGDDLLSPANVDFMTDLRNYWGAASAYPLDNLIGALYRTPQLTEDHTTYLRQLTGAMDRTQVLTTVVAVLFGPDGCRFRGDTESYYNQLNSYIDTVIIRRKGIPLSLCALTKLVAAHCGLRGLHFSGMPGHVMLSQFLRPRTTNAKATSQCDALFQGTPDLARI